MGSSQFAYWGRLQEDFPDYALFNAAVGGSQAKHWAEDESMINDLVLRWDPAVIVVYIGSNDVMANQSVSATAQHIEELYRKLRASVKASVRIVFVGAVI